MRKDCLKNTKLDCAVIGLGVGEQHALEILKGTKSQLKYINDINIEKCHSFIETYGNDISMASYEEILQDQDLKLVCIASFDDAHYQQVMDAMVHHKHIFVEKPLCQTRSELSNIVNLWAHRKIALCSNLVLRESILFTWVKEKIKEGAFGDIYAMDADYLYGRIHKITEGWRKDVSNYSVMAGGGIHMIDLLLELTGQKPIKVQSSGNKIVTKNTAFKYHDYQCSNFYFENGFLARITANFGCVHPHQHYLRIFGTRATFIYDEMGARVHWGTGTSAVPEKIELSAKPNSKGVLVAPFIESILNNSFENYAKREFELMSVLLSADEALSYSQPIPVEYIL